MNNNKGSHITNTKKKRLEEKEQNMKKQKRKKILSLIGKGFISLIGAILIIAIILVGKIAIAYEEDIAQLFVNAKSKVEDATKETFNSKQPTRVFDKNGEVIYEFKEVDYIYTPYKDLNPYVPQAFIAIEDNRFMDHQGMDYMGTIRAVITNITTGSMHGASSITQQLTKNVFLSAEQTISRKLEEAIIASHLEKKFTKEQIMEFYVNNIYYGHGNYSLESASQYYFSKNNKDLEISEVAILAGVINNPTKYDPISNPENATHRRNRIIEKMYEEKFIDKKTRDEEIAKPLGLKVKDRNRDNTIKDGTISYAIDCATETFMAQNGFQFQYEFKTKEERVEYWKHYNEEYKLRREQLLTGGYDIYTIIDRELNKNLLDIANKHLKSYTAKNENGIYKKQVSLTVIDNKTGEVVSMVGGRGQDNDQLNRAFQAPRQPGSTIKPLLSYAPAFERGYLPSSTMVDSEVPNGPKNANGGYSGTVTLRHALEKSINTIPYRLAMKFGVDELLPYLAEMQFQTLTERDYNPIISVGGFTKGVTTKEMSSAFATLARGGEFIAPTNIEKIVKRNTGEVVYKNNKDKIRIYDEGASYLTIDSLKGVLTNGTGVRYKPEYANAFAKTGTTNQKKDSWLVGGTPYYTVAVWVGDDKPTPQGSTIMSGSIWKDTINLLHKGKEVIDFKQPSSVKMVNGQLVNDIYLNKKENNAEQRRKMEMDRIKREKALQKERLDSEDYRILHGLTKEEELEREAKAQEALAVLQAYSLIDESQFEELDRLLEHTKAVIDDVKHKVAHDRFMNSYNSLKSKFNSIKQQILNPPTVPDTSTDEDESTSTSGSGSSDSNNETTTPPQEGSGGTTGGSNGSSNTGSSENNSSNSGSNNGSSNGNDSSSSGNSNSSSSGSSNNSSSGSSNSESNSSSGSSTEGEQN